VCQVSPWDDFMLPSSSSASVQLAHQSFRLLATIVLPEQSQRSLHHNIHS
jgi:hypothetical protein